MLTFLNLSIGRCLDDWFLLLSGTTDDLALDGHAPTVVPDFDVDVLLADARQLGFDDVRVALLRNVDGRAQSIPSQSKEWVVEHRAASAMVSDRGPADERVLEHPEERAEFAEEVPTERHLTFSGGEGFRFELRGDRLTSPVYIPFAQPLSGNGQNVRERSCVPLASRRRADSPGKFEKSAGQT